MEHLRGITTDAAGAVNSFRLLCSTNWRMRFAMPPLWVIDAGQFWLFDALERHREARDAPPSIAPTTDLLRPPAGR
jgi:hypothetical protein